MDVLQSALLAGIQRIEHGFFFPGTSGGIEDNLSFKNGPVEQVRQARKRACDLIGISHEDLTHVYQEHGTQVWTVEPKHKGAGALTGEHQIGCGDGMITSESGVPLAILIADCLPILFSSADGSVVGIAHAGWRGTYDNIAGRMIERMTDEYTIDPAQLYVWIGPGISIRGFTVQNDVWSLFQDRWGEYEDCYDHERCAIDLKLLNRIMLQNKGVPAHQIECADSCTFSDARFFSYRRDGAGIGHNMAVIQKGTAHG